MRGGAPWRASLALDGGAAGAGVAAVWARAKIDSLGLAARRGEQPDGARAAILEVALRYGLVSKFTALVAVDRTPARPPEAALGSAEVPTNLPEGWVHEKVFGRQAAAPSPTRVAATVDPGDPGQPLALPQTATDWMLQLAIGLALIGFALALGLGWGWRRP
jgi:Ca-activated chloride channel family protein